MKQKKDDGVSSIVAVMLVLCILVIGITVFLGTYLPDMKESSEIQNSSDIREKFMNYASSVDSLYTTQQTGQFSWTINLGAGDIILSPSKSSGILELNPERELVTVSSEPDVFGDITCNSVDIEYSPSMTYWRDIGYLYSRGVVTVTNPSADSDYLTLSEASQNGYSYDAVTKTLTLITWERGTEISKSGSGPATLTLKLERDPLISGEYSINNPTTVRINHPGGTQTINLLQGTTIKVVLLHATVNIL